jgi:hypothetical protein
MRISIIISLALAGAAASAEVISWTNTSNGNWGVAANWSPNQVPSTNDTAVITNAGIYTVTLNLDPTIAGLVLGGQSGTQTVATAGHTLTLNGSGLIHRRGWLLLSGGAISGSNQISLDGGLAWQSGALDTNTAVSVTTNGQVNLASAGNYAKLLYGRLTNDGTVTWQSYGNLGIGGTLHNRTGALFDAQVNNRSIVKSGANALLINDGVFRKSTSASSIPCYVPLHNRGTVDNQTGTLTLRDGAVLHSGSVFVGAGVTRLESGVVTLAGDLFATNLVLAGATLAGTGSLSGVVTWESGTISNTAAITVAPDGHLRLSSGGNDPKVVQGNLTNAGTVTFSNYGNLSLGGTLHNRPGALFDVQTDNRTIARAGSAALIINDGVFRRSVGTGTVLCGVPTVNNGTLESLSGTLQFDEAFSNPLGIISLAGGTLNMIRGLWLAGGRLTGWGTFIGDVTNAACIQPARSNGVLTIRGRCEQLLGGRMEFELAGNSPGINQSRLNVSGTAMLRGTVSLLWAEGYVPELGTSFAVLTFASHAGEFCCFDKFLLLGQGRRLMPAYGATNLTLATIAAPEPTSVPLRVTVDGGALVCWPSEFSGYELLWSTNVSATNWTLLPGVTNRWLEPPPLAREKFYRLHKP